MRVMHERRLKKRRRVRQHAASVCARHEHGTRQRRRSGATGERQRDLELVAQQLEGVRHAMCAGHCERLHIRPAEQQRQPRHAAQLVNIGPGWRARQQVVEQRALPGCERARDSRRVNGQHQRFEPGRLGTLYLRPSTSQVLNGVPPPMAIDTRCGGWYSRPNRLLTSDTFVA